MQTSDIKKQFNSCVDNYDAGRRHFIPCFDDYYETGVNLLSFVVKDCKAILDLGAGTGLLTKYLYAKFPRAHFTLVDVAEKMLDVAKVRFQGKPNFTYKIADYSAAFPDDDFDLIVSALSIHHLSEAEKFALYSLVFKKLPKDGVLMNLDQFNADSPAMTEACNQFWLDYIQHSDISKEEFDRWVSRKALDQENSISNTLTMLRRIGFRSADCVYQYPKFGVIIAVK